MPLIIAHSLKGRRQLVAVAHQGETDPALGELVESLQWVRLGQFKKILKFLAREGVEEVMLAGGITKAKIWHIRPDTLALKLATRLRHLHDDMLLRGVAEELESQGFKLRGVAEFLPELLAPNGILSSRRPTREQWQELQFGWNSAKALGQLDIGQGVVVRQKVVVAVEAMEGTDAMLERAGKLISGRRVKGDAVFVKVAKPQQDRRLDLPAVGPKTIENLHAAGIPILAIEAGSAMILDPDATLAAVEKYGLVMVGCSEEEMAAVDRTDGVDFDRWMMRHDH
ncbi:MAG: UDP-2,3-diacylglucosamine diphosphatase LpxI [Magnetococcales bacterium]|nr:UDP-2,3-diacylglucosamine diphosphatase LpxI [Magnetococcales bacterium]